MRIVMLGTGPFAVPTFRALLASRHDVVALVTRPARLARGKGPAPENPMRRVAEPIGLPVYDPESINSSEAIELLRGFAADLLVVCDYGQILSPEALATTVDGGINLHASLLPKYRGAAPINWAIYCGETQTGVTVIHMTAGLDAGPCLVQVARPIGPDETAVEVEAALAELGVAAVLEAIDALDGLRPLQAVGQDRELATRAPRLKKADGLVTWERRAEEIRNQVRAFQPWPKTYTLWHRSTGEPLRLILEQVTVEPEGLSPASTKPQTGELLSATGEPLLSPVEDGTVEPTASKAAGEKTPPSSTFVAPGTVVQASGGRFVVACGQGLLRIDAVQPAGKRVMTAEEFLRGYPVREGALFGGE